MGYIVENECSDWEMVQKVLILWIKDFVVKIQSGKF